MKSHQQSNRPTTARCRHRALLWPTCLVLAGTLAWPQGAGAAETSALRSSDFLNSIGANSSGPERGQPLEKTIEMVKYVGLRWLRGGIEGWHATSLQEIAELHRQTGVRFSWSPGSGGSDLTKLLDTARQVAAGDMLLAFEGPNEPNNWGLTYQGEQGGGKAPSWLAVAKFQSDLYKAVKNDPVLGKYPVWSISEVGAETDNVGLQFLTIPEGAGTLMPAGTRFADFAVAHNYIYHQNAPGLADNKTWNASDPTSACKVDGLYGNYGQTWAKHFRGYSEAQLLTLPRVTTETGCTVDGPVTEQIQGLNILSLYLDQFKRGWSYTSLYILRDRTDESGNQTFGMFRPDYTPRKAAIFMHNLTTILADQGSMATPGKLDYSIADQPATVHDMLLQNSDGNFELVIWGERVKGDDRVTVHFATPPATLKVYDPTIGTEPVATSNGVATFRLKLSDHPIILVIPAPR